MPKHSVAASALYVPAVAKVFQSKQQPAWTDILKPIVNLFTLVSVFVKKNIYNLYLWNWFTQFTYTWAPSSPLQK
jgi:hypothetical protein